MEFYFLFYTVQKVKRQMNYYVKIEQEQFFSVSNAKIYAKGIGSHFNDLSNILDVLGQLSFIAFYALYFAYGCKDPKASNEAAIAAETAIDKAQQAADGKTHKTVFVDITSYLFKDPSRVGHVFHYIALIAGIMNSIISFFNLFKSTRYLVFMISEVIGDFYPFLTVFCTVLLQYSFINIYMQQHMDETDLVGGGTNMIDAFMTCWSIILVDHDYEYQTVIGKTVYLVMSTWLIIIMLNLLIAIVSATHESVDEHKGPTDYKIKCEILWQITKIEQLMKGSNLSVLYQFPLILLYVIFLTIYTMIFYILYYLLIRPVKKLILYTGYFGSEDYGIYTTLNEGGASEDSPNLVTSQLNKLNRGYSVGNQLAQSAAFHSENFYYLHIIRKLRVKTEDNDWEGRVDSAVIQMKAQLLGAKIMIESNDRKNKRAIQKMNDKYEESRQEMSKLKGQINALLGLDQNSGVSFSNM